MNVLHNFDARIRKVHPVVFAGSILVPGGIIFLMLWMFGASIVRVVGRKYDQSRNRS